jgi:hypothetical protein
MVAKMMRSVSLVVVASVVVFGLVGCSGVPAPRPSASPVESAQAGRNVPFGLKVVDEVNDGQRLHILASIESRTPWDPSRVMVRLTGFSGEKVLGVSDYPLLGSGNSGAAAVFEPGRPFDVSLSIPVVGVTDYQLELLWGEESGMELQSAAPSPLQLRNVAVIKSAEPCSAGRCPVVYEVSGELINSGPGTIARAALGVGFLPHVQGGGGLVAGIPAEEEVVDIAALALEPGRSRPIKLSVEQPELVGGGELSPVVRVLSFEAALPAEKGASSDAG